MDQTSAICTSLASSVESFILATSILLHSIDHSHAQLHHLPWMFLQFLLCVVAQKMLKAFFVLTSLCIHIHQERGSQLSTWIYRICPLILHEEKLRFLASFSFETQFWSAPKWPRTGTWRGHLCSNRGNPTMVRPRSDTAYNKKILVLGNDWQCVCNKPARENWSMKLCSGSKFRLLFRHNINLFLWYAVEPLLWDTTIQGMAPPFRKQNLVLEKCSHNVCYLY